MLDDKNSPIERLKSSGPSPAGHHMDHDPASLPINIYVHINFHYLHFISKPLRFSFDFLTPPQPWLQRVLGEKPRQIDNPNLHLSKPWIASISSQYSRSSSSSRSRTPNLTKSQRYVKASPTPLLRSNLSLLLLFFLGFLMIESVEVSVLRCRIRRFELPFVAAIEYEDLDQGRHRGECSQSGSCWCLYWGWDYSFCTA